MMRRLSWPNRIGVACIVVMLVVAVVLLLRTTTSPETETPLDTRSPRPPAPATSEPAVARTDPPELVATKRQVERTLKRFVVEYYSRTPEMYVGDEAAVRQRMTLRIEPLATPKFMTEIGIPDLAIDDLAAEVRDGASFKASIDPTSVVGHIEQGGSAATIAVTVILNDQESRRVVRTIDVEFGIEKSGAIWRVSNL